MAFLPLIRNRGLLTLGDIMKIKMYLFQNFLCFFWLLTEFQGFKTPIIRFCNYLFWQNYPARRTGTHASISFLCIWNRNWHKIGLRTQKFFFISLPVLKVITVCTWLISLSFECKQNKIFKLHKVRNTLSFFLSSK